MALGARKEMWRLKVWSIVYTPMFFGLLILIYANETVGKVIMSLTIPAVPFAMKYENNILQSKGIDVTKGSPIGNFLAKILGVIVVGGALSLFYTMAHNIYTGNF